MEFQTSNRLTNRTPTNKAQILLLACVISGWLGSIVVLGQPALASASSGHCCPVNESAIWHKHVNSLDSDITEKVRPFLNYGFMVPERFLTASLSYYGAAVRLRNFVSKMMTESQPLKVGVIGGSISVGKRADRIGVDDWFAIVAKWLASVSRSNITARNGAIGGTPSAYMVLCLQYSVDPDVDLVFVEYAFNDGFEDGVTNNGVVMAMERLLRRVLDLPGRPAVVLVQAPLITANGYWPYFSTSEHLQAANAALYDIPTVSPHTALYQLSVAYPTAGYEYDRLYTGRHPANTAHKAMADTAVHVIQTAVLDLLRRPITPDEEEERLEPLPLPMYAGNVAPDSSSCAVGHDFARLAKSHDGWQWANEGTAAQPKWGYVASAPGATLVLEFDTVRTHLRPHVPVPVVLYYLASYTHMGVARLSCVSGCVCNGTEVDAHITAHVSQAYLSRVIATQAKRCRLEVRVLPNTSSGGHKFKVIGIVVTDQPESAPLQNPGIIKFPKSHVAGAGGVGGAGHGAGGAHHAGHGAHAAAHSTQATRGGTHGGGVHSQAAVRPHVGGHRGQGARAHGG